MGKMKELFMKTNYPHGDYDLEREYLIDDMLAQERQYEEENPFLTTKIEVANGDTITRVEIGKEEQENHLKVKRS